MDSATVQDRLAPALQHFQVGLCAAFPEGVRGPQKECRNYIYYIPGVAAHIVLEVLYMVDLVAEYWRSSSRTPTHKFKSTTKEGLDIEGEDEKKKLEVLKAEAEEELGEGGSAKRPSEYVL